MCIRKKCRDNNIRNYKKCMFLSNVQSSESNMGKIVQTEVQMMPESNWCGQEVGVGGVSCKGIYLAQA